MADDPEKASFSFLTTDEAPGVQAFGGYTPVQIDADWLRKVLADNPEAVKVIAEAVARAMTNKQSLRPTF